MNDLNGAPIGSLVWFVFVKFVSFQIPKKVDMEIGYCKGCYDENPGHIKWNISDNSKLYAFYKHKNNNIQHKTVIPNPSINQPQDSQEGMIVLENIT